MKSQILYFLAITIILFNCSPANIIISGTKRPPISKESVVVYNSQTIPETHEIIGRILVKSESTLGRRGALKRNMKKLSEKAASVGANGLIIEDTQDSNTFFGDEFMSVNATAIYIGPDIQISTKESKKTNEINKSKTDRLRELKKLLDEGILSQKEYEKEKGKILDEK